MPPNVPAELQEVYEHWERGDWTLQFGVYSEDFEWGWSADFPGLGGVFHDDEMPNSRLRAWLSPWDHWEVKAEGYERNGDTVVILTRYQGRGKSGGVTIDQEGAHVWVLRGGRAVRLEVFANREAALASAGLA